MEQQVIITTDLGYGDAGKGTMVDALVHHHDVDLVVRYSGGAQAAHNVVTPDGRHHTFAQFGSGSFRPGTRTYLGPQVLVHPQLLLSEAEALQHKGVSADYRLSPLGLLHIDERAPVITPYHQIVNQLKELARGMDRHGSTGIGIGETRADSEDTSANYLRAGDLYAGKVTEAKLADIRERKQRETLPLLQEHARNEDIIRLWHQFANDELFAQTMKQYKWFAQHVSIGNALPLSQHIAAGKRVIFEAAQGTLLDEDYGFFPYVTRGKVRSVHAHKLLSEVDFTEKPYVLGITRAYAARHGPGPFPTESPKLRNQITEAHNGHGQWQGAFRMGHFDAVATRYAIAANEQVDGLAVTSLDQLMGQRSFFWSDQYVDQSGKGLDEIPWCKPGDLAAMADRSSYLMEAVAATYQETATSTEAILSVIDNTCGVPVVATSSGVTREEKMFFHHAARKAA